jgi:hypothetical protein
MFAGARPYPPHRDVFSPRRRHCPDVPPTRCAPVPALSNRGRSLCQEQRRRICRRRPQGHSGPKSGRWSRGGGLSGLHALAETILSFLHFDENRRADIMTDSFLPNIVQRSYELARSGTCAGIEEVRRRLRSEGYADATAQLTASPSLRKDLTRLCLQAQGKFEAVRAGQISGLQNQ